MPQPPLIRKGNGAPTAKYLALSAPALGAFLFCERFFGGHTATSHTTMRRWSNAREREKEKNRIRRNCTKEEEKAPFSSLFAAFLFRPITTHVGRCCCVVMLLGKKGKELYMLHVCGAFSSSLFLYSAVRRRRGISVRGRESGMTFTNHFQN